MSSVLISVRALFLFCDEESFSPRLLPIVVAAVVPATVVAIATAPPVVEAAAHCKQKPQTMSKMSSGRKEFIQPKLDVDDDCFPVFREVCWRWRGVRFLRVRLRCFWGVFAFVRLLLDEDDGVDNDDTDGDEDDDGDESSSPHPLN